METYLKIIIFWFFKDVILNRGMILAYVVGQTIFYGENLIKADI